MKNQWQQGTNDFTMKLPTPTASNFTLKTPTSLKELMLFLQGENAANTNYDLRQLSPKEQEEGVNLIEEVMQAQVSRSSRSR